MIPDEHVLLIDKKLTFIPTNSLNDNVKSINLHCNEISQISGLQHLAQLTSLDLSSNKLTSIAGLSDLVSLKTLNLASNLLTKVEGLAGLFQLKHINLSYNKISSLHGFVELHGSDSRLQVILLHENNLLNLRHVLSCLQGLISLRHLILKQEGLGNPLANATSYRAKVLQDLPQLTSLDYIDRQQKRVDVEDLNSRSDWDFLDLLDLPADSEVLPVTPKIEELKTPCIDAAFASRAASFNKKSSPIQTSAQKLLLSPSSSTATSPVLIVSNKPTTIISDSGRSKTCATPNSSSSFVLESSEPSAKVAEKSKISQSSQKSKAVGPLPKQARKATTVTKCVIKKKHGSIPVRKLPSKSNSTGALEKDSYVNMLKDLESERERRWKAEEASRRLAGIVRDLKAKDCEEKSLQEVAASTTERLKQALLNEKKTNDQLRSENHDFSKQIKSRDEELRSLKEQKHTSVHNLQNALTNANAQLSKLQAKLLKERQEFQTAHQSLKSNYDAVSRKNEELLFKIENLQSLFIDKESEKKKSACEMYTLANDDFRRALSLQFEKEEKRHQREIEQLEQQIGSLRSDYAKLECEFREALLIESERYKSLHNHYTVANENAKKFESMLVTASEKEEKCRLMMSEMTSIIKEQKVKLSELVKSKEDVSKQCEKQIDFLQQENSQNRKKLQQFEALKQEKSQLSSKFSALQSVVDGLKEERRLWSQELAEQGSALSKDRGRLEMKIESLKAEISSLRKNNERDLDSLRIKSKVVEDQTETIFKMKEALTLKDKEIRAKLDEQLIEQQHLHDTIDDLTKENTSLQNDNANLVERKQQLKNELADLTHDYEVLQENYESQKLKWLDKGALLSKLEQQVKTASQINRQKQEDLMKERDAAKQALEVVKNKNDELYETYQKELQTASNLHEQEMQRVIRDKAEEVERMKKKVDSVEMEMRELLRETDVKKKAMEMKVERLKSLIQEIS